jgi:hypothetical protein
MIAVLIFWGHASAFREDLNQTDLSLAPIDLDDPSAPRNVYVTTSVNKVGEIDTISGTFRFDFYLYMAWRDDRQREGIFRADDRYWWPRPELMNWHAGGTRGEYLCSFSTGAPTFTGFNISDGMWAFCQARHQAVLDADILLHDFPFDRQRAEIVIESFLWSVSKLRFVALPTLQIGLARLGKNAVGGWRLETTGVTVFEYTYKQFGERYHRLKIMLTLARLPDFYISRFVWGAIFLVAMALLTLFIPANEPDRLGFAQGSFLGIVAWQFVLVSATPPTGYNNRMDNYMIVSMVCVFIIYVWNSVR